MKKRNKILMVIVLIIVIGISCYLFYSNQRKMKEKIEIGTGNIDGQAVQVTLEHEEDILEKQTIEKVTPYEILGEDITDEKVKELAEEQKSIYSQMNGVVYSYEVGESEVSEVITIDFKKADIDQLVEYGIIENSSISENGDTKTVSMRATKAGFELAYIEFEEKNDWGN